ncbi:MAG TPA: response regulator transcription factor [Gaiellaceae bacterium]|nr:response regulator transcription factor [Gaiellaceae bacterium]
MTAADDRVGVLVVDDSAESRAAIESVVVQTPGFELVGSVASGEEALDVLPQVEPDLVLLDVRMPGLSGSETSRLIQISGARAVVVLVSAHPRPELPDSVDECGAAAILHKRELCPRSLGALWQRVQAHPSCNEVPAPW